METRKKIDKINEKSEIIRGTLFSFYENLSQAKQEKVKIEEKNLDMSLMPLDGDKYFTENIKKEVYKFKYNRLYKFKVNKKKIKLYITDYEKKNYKKMIEKIKNILFFVTKYVDEDCIKILNLHLYLTNQKKEMPSDGKIKEKNINSAFTYTRVDSECIDNNHVYIYRKEELVRALIHELMHAFNIEKKFRVDTRYNDEINRLFNIENSNLLLEEMLAESYAGILNLVFSEKISLKNKESFLKSFMKVYYVERDYLLFQCIKLLKMFKIKYEDLLKVGGVEKINLKTDTNVFSYIFLKAMLFIDLEKVFEVCYGDKKLIGCEKTDKFYEIIKYKYRSEEFMRYLKYGEKLYKKEKNKTRKKTLRLTIVE